MYEKTLAVCLIQMRHSGKSSKRVSREGYCDGKGQTFTPPVSTKRVQSWRQSMEEKGYTFASA